MNRLFIFIITLSFTLSASAQQDTLSISLSTFTKKKGQSEILYVAVFIKSNIRDSIEIDDSRSWINCINAFGVKLVAQTLEDDCYKEVVKSECHIIPTISTNDEDIFKDVLKSLKIEGFGEHSYVVEVLHVAIAEETDLKRTFKDFKPYRFKLELPYRYGKKAGIAKSKYWTYYAQSR